MDVEPELLDSTELVERCDALCEAVSSGGRTTRGGVTRRDFAAMTLRLAGIGTWPGGDERVMSKVSTKLIFDLSAAGAGIGEASIVGREPSGFVGVVLHTSKVVCFDFPSGEDVEALRRPRANCWVLGFLAGIGNGKGSPGEFTKSNVPIVFETKGDVARRSRFVLVAAGSVWERCIGARLLFVTLAGRSSNPRTTDSLRDCSGVGNITVSRTGDEDSKLMTLLWESLTCFSFGWISSESFSCAFANA